MTLEIHDEPGTPGPGTRASGASASGAPGPGTPRPGRLDRLRLHHAAYPVTSAAALFAVLAAVRVAGAFTFVVMVLSVALSAAVLLVLPRTDWAAAGVRRFPLMPAVLGTALVAVVYGQTFLATRDAFGDGDDNWTTWMPKLFEGTVPGAPWADVVAMVLALGVLVPLVEEVCYRGVLYRAVEVRWGGYAAVVTTAAGWAAVHVGDYGLNPFNLKVLCGLLPSVFLMGLALGVLRAVTGSALACAAAQGVCNLLLLGAAAAWL
ncbi:CPBP family intramembrane glutamic endopeptidase [Streptomyces alboflavus]|uniref:CPBP family intramembrane glutamic endopeptidase n=1 Tax=Streptomyces alboflavus TaxID=67267 RepID=UPI001F3F0039|nr:CPBP family intramembrane glutamic endopeptidase [Streptomyces alboflavus]